jgi:hypothetical protein
VCDTDAELHQQNKPNRAIESNSLYLGDNQRGEHMTDEIRKIERQGSKFYMEFQTDGLFTPDGEQIKGGGVAEIRLDWNRTRELLSKAAYYCDYVCGNCGKVGVRGGICQGKCKPLVRDPRSTKILNPSPTSQLEAEAKCLAEEEQKRAETEAQEQQDAENVFDDQAAGVQDIRRDSRD